MVWWLWANQPPASKWVLLDGRSRVQRQEGSVCPPKGHLASAVCWPALDIRRKVCTALHSEAQDFSRP